MNTDFETLSQEQAGEAVSGAAAVAPGRPSRPAKRKRIASQSINCPPVGAVPEFEGRLLGRKVVPVSFVARDWNISARRVRVMLAEGRLGGRQLENGYWEVYFPYFYTFGTRGPQLKRQQKGLEEIAKRPKRLRGEDAEAWNDFKRETSRKNSVW